MAHHRPLAACRRAVQEMSAPAHAGLCAALEAA